MTFKDGLNLLTRAFTIAVCLYIGLGFLLSPDDLSWVRPLLWLVPWRSTPDSFEGVPH